MGSDIRLLAIDLAEYAEDLREKALSFPQLKNTYNSVCDVLDYFNWELEVEPFTSTSGPIPVSWQRFEA